MNNEEITVKRTLAYLESVPRVLHRLYAFYCGLSQDGRYKVYPTAQYCYRTLGCSRSQYYAWRKRLVALGLIRVELRKVALRYNRPSLVSVASLKSIASRLYARVQSLVSPGFRTQIPVPYTCFKKPVAQYGYRQSLTYQQLMTNGLGEKRGTT